MKRNIFIGLDPGKEGFITIYDPINEWYEFIPMPSHKVPSGKKLKSGLDAMVTEFHKEGMKNLVIHILKNYEGCNFHAVLEEVIGRQGWSAQNNFNFGHTAGLQMMVLIMIGADIKMVRPIKWQAIMYQGFDKVLVPSSTGKTMVHDTKATSKIVAQKLGPEIDFRKTTRSTNLDDNKTDSFLMALYSQLIFKKQNNV
tara:strand:+ start:151 stop:744 length:594 start_codon:yes stop_codon:yes gene_type:complete